MAPGRTRITGRYRNRRLQSANPLAQDTRPDGRFAAGPGLVSGSVALKLCAKRMRRSSDVCEDALVADVRENLSPTD
ncbi:hypothetical protein GCM10009764_75760 [Nocardia ninae]|uniref:Uncharacterized protein n=1 Tax=Nocardia ninae NBRC 108245 TaxID=1210091 RepID=A0A511MGG0_9NOCA|nr:hypothetical protein NN4_42940 [Nocardia ninae NBRC 108245]